MNDIPEGQGRGLPADPENIKKLVRAIYQLPTPGPHNLYTVWKSVSPTKDFGREQTFEYLEDNGIIKVDWNEKPRTFMKLKKAMNLGDRLIIAREYIKTHPGTTKAEMERATGISSFNAQRWQEFLTRFKDEIVQSSITGKVYFVGR